jgi:hypothetical protein
MLGKWQKIAAMGGYAGLTEGVKNGQKKADR